eukprot:CAMPEP_0202001066 /NCGR_PEP_ID=MMETSP0905-20130828/7267_1 /ASSEMBLY_ACC=CAM_ASM_000554 /TAXON_ID=420261 /ORGANISM="Thalassiosira antarctica, Strain CCMP982" /LENGTH=315 /DNA_ID=CAMNT_0048557689 /DNA_START=72 /DNA_END=1019 /DNA_ORIENTATION=-
MKGIYTGVTLIVACAASLPEAWSFAPVLTFGQTTQKLGQTSKRIDFPINTITPSAITSQRETIFIAKSSNDGSDGNNSDAPGFFSGIKISPPYALAYILFLGYAYVRQSSEPDGASMEIIQQYIADPLNPGFNELFITIFNLLGLYVVPMACLLMPGAKDQKLPATPFVLGSMFGGYGALGIYASTRTPNASPVSKADLGWFTANILENKLFNYFIALVFSSAYITSGALGAFISDPLQLIKGYGDLFSETAIVSVSSLDFAILTIAAASFIPEDLSRRGYEGKVAPELVALCTALLPGVGVALYCALRPSLDEE